MNLLFTDFETSRLEAETGEILDIGAVLCDAESLDVIKEYSSKVRLEHLDLADPISLAINGYNDHDWKDAPSLSEAWDGFEPLTEGATFTAANVCFDYDFYRAALKKLNRKNRLHYHRLDVGSMGFPLVRPVQMSLDKLCLILGIQPEPAPHRGLNGARREREVVLKLLNMAAEGKALISNCSLQSSRF